MHILSKKGGEFWSKRFRCAGCLYLSYRLHFQNCYRVETWITDKPCLNSWVIVIQQTCKAPGVPSGEAALEFEGHSSRAITLHNGESSAPLPPLSAVCAPTTLTRSGFRALEGSSKAWQRFRRDSAEGCATRFSAPSHYSAHAALQHGFQLVSSPGALKFTTCKNLIWEPQ